MKSEKEKMILRASRKLDKQIVEIQAKAYRIVNDIERHQQEAQRLVGVRQQLHQQMNELIQKKSEIK